MTFSTTARLLQSTGGLNHPITAVEEDTEVQPWIGTEVNRWDRKNGCSSTIRRKARVRAVYVEHDQKALARREQHVAGPAFNGGMRRSTSGRRFTDLHT